MENQAQTTNQPLHLPEPYLQQVQAILKTHLPDCDVWAYGSRVRGDHFEASDLDLVVRPPKNELKKPFFLSDLREAFVESNLPIMVQIVDWSAIPESFHDEILSAYVIVQTAQTGSEVRV